LPIVHPPAPRDQPAGFSGYRGNCIALGISEFQFWT
jgi:hypothetical protein